MDTKSFQTIADYEAAASEKLGISLTDYVQKRAGEGKTYASNLSAFEKYELVPRVLAGIKNLTTTTKVLGKEISAPIMVAPVAWHKMYTPEGEVSAAQAAKESGINFVVSCFSTLDFRQIDQNSLSHTWYQLLMYKDINLMKKYIAQAEAAGCAAILLTVDAPIGCSMCKTTVKRAAPITFPVNDLPLFPKDPAVPYDNLDDYYRKYMSPAQSWDDIKELVASTKLPVILKGILHPADAEKAVKIGVKGIVISNHGGRQLDNVLGTLDALATIPDKVKSKIDVYLDGGVRTGADIFKALALGAKAVFIGRAAIYGLAVNGKDGLNDVVGILSDELKRCMTMTGCESVSQISEDLLFKK
ncbi:MAG: alpha-hydroxy acid oxidase [bacterium]